MRERERERGTEIARDTGGEIERQRDRARERRKERGAEIARKSNPSLPPPHKRSQPKPQPYLSQSSVCIVISGLVSEFD